MNPSDLNKVAARLPLSKSTLAKNLPSSADHLSGGGLVRGASCSSFPAPPRTNPPLATASKRVRQDKPMNQLEYEWFEKLAMDNRWSNLRAQALRFKLASGAWYKPDATGILIESGVMFAWECKGPKKARWSRRGELTIKYAANEWPEISWWLCWKESGEWKQQKILPGKHGQWKEQTILP